MININDEIIARIKLKDPMKVLSLIGYAKSSPTQSGGEIRDFCPFHGGNSQRSLAINKTTGAFKCHNGECNAEGGDNIALYQQWKKCDFMTSIQDLADYFGMHIERESPNGLRDKPRSAPPAFSPAPSIEEQAAQKDEKLAKSRHISAEIWIKSKTVGAHPYFQKKAIEPPDGVRYGKDEQWNEATGEQGNGAIVVPLRDVEGTLQSIQFISDKGKFFATGTTSNEAFFSFGCIKDAPVAYLCEGMATAASVWQGGNKVITTLSCGSASSIHKVATVLRQKHPEIKLIVCLDDDRAGDDTAKKVNELGLPNISFRRPDFTGLERGERDKDFNDLHKLGGIQMVTEQLQKEWTPVNPLYDLGKITLADTGKYYQTTVPGIDIGLVINDEPLELPSGGVTTFAAPTKHGKTHALVNVSYLAMERNKDLDIVFITLEELVYPIALRFLSRGVGMLLSLNNRRSLAYYFKHEKSDQKFGRFSKEVNRHEFELKKDIFSEKFLNSGRLRILDFNHRSGTLDILQQLEEQVREIKKYLPRVGMIAVDYLQLMNLEGNKRISRDEALKEICIGLKNLAASTGLPIITAAQFNRQVLNEAALHPSAIGEGGAVERQSALVFGMFNRGMPQLESVGKPIIKPRKEEILLQVMLNRNGKSQQKLVLPFNGIIGRIDFDKATLEESDTKTQPPKEGKVKHNYVDKEEDWAAG